MIRDAQDLADELAAERAYGDMLAHPELVVDAFDLFDTAAAFDHCDRRRHYARCATADCKAWHHCWDSYTRYHDVEACPNGSETVDGAWHGCSPPAEAE